MKLTEESDFFAVQENLGGSSKGAGRAGKRVCFDCPEVADGSEEIEDIPRTGRATAPVDGKTVTSDHESQTGEFPCWGEHPTDLEQRDRFRALVEIADHGGEQARKEAVAKLGLVVAEGIFERDGCSKICGVGIRDEGARAALVKTHAGKTAAEVHRKIVGQIRVGTAGEEAFGAGGDFFDSNDTSDFLDEIGLTKDFATISGDFPFAASRVDQAHADKGRVDFSIGNFQAENRSHAVMAKGDFGAGRKFTCDLEDFGGGAACELKNQFDSTGGGGGDALGIDAALEAVAGIAEKTQRARGAANARGFEKCAFEKNVGGGLGDSAPLASHHARKGNGAVVVGDDEGSGGEFVFLSVESVEILAFCSSTNADVARDFGGVERVEWLAEFEKNIVRDIDHIIDRTQTDGGEAVDEPLWAGTDFDARDFAKGVESDFVGGVR